MLPLTSSALSTLFCAILLAVTALFASFRVVTCESPICIVSILPVTSSALSTEFAAKLVAKATAAPPLKLTAEAVTSPVKENALVVDKVVAVIMLLLNLS